MPKKVNFKHVVKTAPIEEEKKAKTKESKEQTPQEYVKSYISKLESQKEKLRLEIEEVSDIIQHMMSLSKFPDSLPDTKKIILSERRKLIAKYTSKFKDIESIKDDDKKIRKEKLLDNMKNEIKLFDTFYNILQSDLSELFEKQIY